MLSDIFPNAPQVNQDQIDSHTILVWNNGEFKLGFPRGIKRFLAYTRNGPWLKPFCGPRMEDGRDMTAVLMETDDGRHVVIFAQWSFNSSESHIRMEGDGWKVVSQTPTASFFFTLSESFMGFPTAQISCEPWINDFGYCTWNSLGTDVDHRSVLEGVDSLIAVNAAPRVVIVDDGWQQLDSDRRLASVYPRKDKFPGGFRGLVEDLKKRGVEKVFVWSSIAGYWEGFSNPLGFDTWKVPRGGNSYLIPSPRGCYDYYDAFFAHLQQEGIFGVKIDNMDFLDMISDQGIRRAIQDSYMKALEYVSHKYRIKLIWSMAMVPYVFDWFGCRISTCLGPWRNSDDFFPQEINSHYWHNYCNIYNSQFTRQYGHSLDFDMFQTKFTDPSPGADKMPWLHAAARAISGGPLYVTDYVGTHDPSLLHSLISNGTALRFNNYPTVEDPYQSFDDNRLVIAHNGNQYGRLSAYFNFTTQPHSQQVAVGNGEVARAWRAKWALEAAEKARVDLNAGEWELVSLVKIQKVNNKRFANFGLVDKMAGLAGIVSQKTDQNKLEIVCLPGTLGLYLPDGGPEKVVTGDRTVDFKMDGNMGFFQVESERKLIFAF